MDIRNTNENQLYRILSAYLLSYRRPLLLDVLSPLVVLYIINKIVNIREGYVPSSLYLYLRFYLQVTSCCLTRTQELAFGFFTR
jgi:hypothetical protein